MKELEVVRADEVAIGDRLLPEEYDEHLAASDYDAEQAVCEVVTADVMFGMRRIEYVWPDGAKDYGMFDDDSSVIRLKKEST